MNWHIIPYQTHKYHQQKKLTWCGMYTLKNIIESFFYEKDLKIHDYAPTIRNKISWFMLPWTVIKVLKDFWIKNHVWKCTERWIKNKIEFIKKELKTWPLILVIWHAYKWKKNFNLLKAVWMQHYISIRWYDNDKEIFYVYDSSAPNRLIEKNIPIWNMSLKDKDLIKCRSFWWFLIKRFFYISIDYDLK